MLPTDQATPREWLAGGGEMGEFIRAKDWSSTPLGPRERWPQSLRTAVSLVVESKFPMALLWGPELLLIYNDGYRMIAADKHPAALGRSTRDVWAEVWQINEPIFAAATERGETLFFEDKLFPINRHGHLEDAYFTLSYAPVRMEGGTIGGAIVTLQETTARRHAEQALLASERSLAEAQRVANMGSWEWDLKTGEVRWSRQLYAIYGVDPDKFVPSAAAFRSVLHPDDCERVEQMIREVISTGAPVDIEFRIVTPDGSTRTLMSKGDLIRADPDGTPRVMMGVDQDITERKRAEGALRLSEERLKLAIRSGRLGVWDWDVRNNVMVWNDRMLELYGITREQFSGDVSAWENGLHPEDRARAIAESEAALRGERPWDTEFRVQAPDGTVRHIKADGIVLRDRNGVAQRMLGLNKDVTAAREAEVALRKREEALWKTQRILAEGQRIAHVGSFEYIVDTQATVWSEEEYRIYGLDPTGPSPSYEELLAKCIPPDDAARLHETFSAALRSASVFEMEHRIVRPDGSVRRVRNRALPYFDETGKLVRYVGATLDITGAKQAEEALRAAARREAEAEALREADRRKDEFLAMLGHELRNPLAPIRNGLYILDRAPKGGEQARRAQAIIERQFDHLTRLVDDLLDVTRITRGKAVLQRERLDLSDLVRRTVEDHRGAFVQGEIELEVSTEPGEVWVNGDRTRLSQVVGNLLANAVKFTPVGGRTAVAVQADTAHGEAIIRVQDTGRGIAPEFLPRIFETFSQADLTLDRKLGGLGLGLSLVKGLVELHGGSVRAASEGPGKGATFTISLPLDAAAPVETGQGATEVHAPSRRVLVIEDNFDAADSLREVLTLEGHEVEVALTGPEGIEKARAFRPDIVLCDIGLPGMDGYEVARTIRANPGLARVRLIALTGYAAPNDVTKAKEAGFDTHLAKPPSLAAVEKALHSS